MHMLNHYISQIQSRYNLGNATEHTFRGDLQQLLETLVTDIQATNEPKRQLCGAPDYIITKNDIPIGFIEAKNIGDNDLQGKKKTGNKEQFDRYKGALDNLIFTDYLDFHFYQNGILKCKIAIGELTEEGIIARPENFEEFRHLINDFCTHITQTIKSPEQLAEMMAGKAKLLADVIEKSLNSDTENDEDSTLKDQMEAFKDILIHDITARAFADVYAQTICYGMFSARLHDPTLQTFSRQEAATLIPQSNPFLRKLFGYIAGIDIDTRIKWVVEDLTKIFLACNVAKILKNYGKSTKMEDPIIHFYETFLAEYDPKLRKARGVWYTPAPVVNFIVRAVDDVLKADFNLAKGLADTSKTKISLDTQVKDKRKKSGYKSDTLDVHKVQILDPATGTGTFLAEVVKFIHQKFKGQEGIWRGYVENELIPRLNGFELLMASYAMAHLQLDLLLKESGYDRASNKRLQIYLTNSLEEAHPDTGTLFARWLSNEANEANHIKRDAPVMCVLGNPPYSGESANKGEWIMSLMEDYKKEPGGTQKLNERNPKWINDDYVKFLRYGQHYIEKNGSGIVAYICPHGFLDNPTFRGMRWNLLKTYDKIYTIDLHGNSKKKEVSPDGSPDINVFDIQQGVSINIFVKTGAKEEGSLGEVNHYDLYGKRDQKYAFLRDNSLKDIAFTKLPNVAPQYFMVPKDFAKQKKYDQGFSVNELFPLNNVGIVTSRDSFVISENTKSLEERIADFFTLEQRELVLKYQLKENKSWKISDVKYKAKGCEPQAITPISYRPFDNRFIYYDDHFIERSRRDVMQHFLKGENLGLVTVSKQLQSTPVSYYFVTKNIISNGVIRSDSVSIDSVFPLYLYPSDNELKGGRWPNLDPKIVQKIAKGLKLTFTPEKEDSAGTFAPIDLLDYIYAVLHAPRYRETYKEFLKIDFPRVPYPKDVGAFWDLVRAGGKLRQYHLLEAPDSEDYITSYPHEGDNTVTTKIAKADWEVYDLQNQLGRIWINEDQCFEGIPVSAWEFFIGGYQPAQKWLKDRRGLVLDYDDILHYQKIIKALRQTDLLMQDIDHIFEVQ